MKTFFVNIDTQLLSMNRILIFLIISILFSPVVSQVETLTLNNPQIIQSDNLAELQNLKIYKGRIDRTNDHTFDPYKSIHAINFPFLSLIFDPLVLYDPKTKDVLPNLATDWAVTPDGKIWTFQLRTDVTFHDGSIFNAAAVKFNFDRLINPQHENYVNPNDSVMYIEVIRRLISVDILSEFEISLKFSEAYSPLINDLTFYLMVSPNSFNDGFATIGTGPYKYLIAESSATHDFYSRNMAYFKGIPLIKNIEAELIPSHLYFESSDSHDFDLYPLHSRYIEDPYYIAHLNDEVITKWVGLFNFESNVIQNVSVRRAINYAINQESFLSEYNAEANYSPATTLNTVFYNDTPYVQTNSVYFDYNLDKAKQELIAAGFKAEANSPDLFLEVAIVHTTQPFMNSFRQQMLAVGIGVNFQIFDQLDDLFAKESFYDLLITGFTLAGGLDPADSVGNFVSDSLLNFGHFESTTLDNLVALSIKQPIKQYREVIHEKIIQELKSKVPFVNLLGFKVGYNIAVDFSDYVSVSYDRKLQFKLNRPNSDQQSISNLESKFLVNPVGQYFWRSDIVLNHQGYEDKIFSISNALYKQEFYPTKHSETYPYKITPGDIEIDYSISFYFNLRNSETNLMILIFDEGMGKWMVYENFTQNQTVHAVSFGWTGVLHVIFAFDETKDSILDGSNREFYLINSILLITSILLILTYDGNKRFSKKYLRNIEKLKILVPYLKEVIIGLSIVFTGLMLILQWR